MPKARFGTDGLRGVANGELTAELAVALGRAVARVVPAPTFLVGRDTRRSGPFLQAAFAAGVATEGADVEDLGVVPTAGIAYTSQTRGLPAAVVSASHNPFGDNGIKVFGAAGTKLPVAVEQEVEHELDLVLSDSEHPPRRPTGHGVGVIVPNAAAAEHYKTHLHDSLEGRRLDGLRVVLDCANGASSAFAPEVFNGLGAEVLAIACDPDGANINHDCGSTHPETLSRTVVETGADIGLAFDGDADRLVAVNHSGTVADGDDVLALFAVDMAQRGVLPGNAVVVTVMTNLGFRRAMAERGIGVRETPVGDRHVLEALDLNGLALGGEQSGHIVFRQKASTGDGVLTGLALADLVVRKGRSLAELADGLIRRVPQLLVNVPVAQPGQLQDAEAVWLAVAEVERELGESGRVLLRASGTEPLVRVMVEATNEEQAIRVADRLRSVVQLSLGRGDGLTVDLTAVGSGGVVGVGVDAVDVDRFRAVLGRRPGFAERVFTEGERRDAAMSGDPAERLAARFAAKEAVMKALGHGIGSFAFKDVEVVRSNAPGAAGGAPSIRLAPGAAALARRHDVGSWHVSLTHTRTVAIAFVLAERAPQR